MQGEQKQKKGGTTFDVIDNLQKAKDAVVAELSKVKGDRNLIIRSEAQLRAFDDLLSNVRGLAPQIEQLKGLTKGMSLAAPTAKQHIEILKGELSGLEDAEKLKFGRDIIVRVATSLAEAATKQREEQLRTAGKFDGGVMAALGIMRQVETAIENHNRLKEEEKELAQPFPDDNTHPPSTEPNGESSKPRKRAAKKAAKAKVEIVN